MKTYTNYKTDIPRLINNNATDNIAWGLEMINDSLRYLTIKYYFNERTYSTTTTAFTQFYNLPPQVEKVINVTVTVGNVRWQPKPCPTRQMWDNLNNITYYQDYPSYFFVYNGQLGIFPCPSSTGLTVAINYKTRIIDLSHEDVTTGTLAIAQDTKAVTLSSASTANWMASQWLKTTDEQWYQIDTVSSSSTLNLKNNYTGDSVTTGTYIIGQASLIPEDFQDLPLYQMAEIYYSTRLGDNTKAALYSRKYAERFALFDSIYGSKTTNVELDTDYPLVNPNLFTRNLS